MTGWLYTAGHDRCYGARNRPRRRQPTRNVQRVRPSPVLMSEQRNRPGCQQRQRGGGISACTGIVKRRLAQLRGTPQTNRRPRRREERGTPTLSTGKLMNSSSAAITKLRDNCPGRHRSFLHREGPVLPPDAATGALQVECVHATHEVCSCCCNRMMKRKQVWKVLVKCIREN